MLPGIATRRKWFTCTMEQIEQRVSHSLSPPVPLERPGLSQLAQPDTILPRFVVECNVATHCLELLGPLDWDNFPERDPHRPWPGPKPVPRACFAAAFLVKIDQQIRYMSGLRQYLVDHPALVWILGFPLQPSDEYSWGFDADACLPTARHFGRVLRTLDNGALQFLLDGTVHLLRQELPEDVPFGETISCDTKHIIAWVKENNPKAYVKDRYDKDKQPVGDLDCRLGCKRRRNRGEAVPIEMAADAVGETPNLLPTPTTDPVPAKNVSVGEFYWGYGSGVVATKVPGWGEFVLAELTQPFDRNDITYFFTLMADTERRLGRRPQYGTFDTSFDAHYVYQYFHNVGGMAAVPFSERGGITRAFDEAGLPLCQAQLPMPLKSTFICRTTEVEHQRGRYACPLLFPEPSGETCPIAHKNWNEGGCVVTMATCQGARIRYQLDREGEEYKNLYKQRTATERINSQALELGINCATDRRLPIKTP